MPRRLLILCAFVLLFAVGVLLAVRFWGPFGADNFPPGALDDYLPHDAAAVIALDLKDLRAKGVFAKPIGKELEALLTADELGLPFHLLGVEPTADVDSARLAFSARDYGRPLVLLRGRFDRNRFKTGPGQLEELREGGFRLYRFKDAGRETTLALAGDTLAVCLTRPRVVDALRQAKGKRATPLDDAVLTALLETVDRKRAVWVAADLAKLGRPQQLLFEAQLRPIFEQAQTLSGGIVWGEDLGVAIDFGARDEADAIRLVEHLQGVKKLAAALVLFPGIEEYRKAFLRMFANAEVRRDGKDVTLRSRLGL